MAITPEQRKKMIVNYWGHYKCVKCGEDDQACLELHHLNGRSEKMRKVNLNHLSPNDFIKELEQCVPLCANCHRKVHRHGSKLVGLQQLHYEVFLDDFVEYDDDVQTKV